MTESERIAQLTANAQKGDTAAFESLYDTYGKRIWYFCRCLLGEDTVAVEVTRDVFLYAWRNLRSMPAGQTFYRWVCGNAFYFGKIAMAGLRGTGITVEAGEEDAANAALFDEMTAESGQTASDINVRRSDLETVTELFSGLPDGERICILLHDYACFPVEEVAGVAGCSVETVKSRLYNGHTALCQGLEARTPGSGEAFRTFLGRLLRTCGKNSHLPEEVTQSIRDGLAQGIGEEFPPPSSGAPTPKQPFLTKKQLTLLYTLLGVLLIGALAYVIYWFASAPEAPDGDTPSQTQSDASSTESTLLSEPSADLSAASNSSESATVSGDESEPEESSLPGVPVSSGTSSSEESSRSETSTAPAPLPRTTDNLRLRTSPDASVSDNIVTTIPMGSHIEILDTVTAEDGSVWYKASYTNAAGTRFDGYCSADYVKTEDAA